MDSRIPKTKNLKVFFIKLISISIAIILIINTLFNLLLSERFKQIDNLLLFTNVENRQEYGDKLRESLNDLLEKDNLIYEEDKVLLYKLYKKLKSEFEDIKQ
jgi:hypothetical protein